MKKMNRKGFTIVELVIVIAVIAILAGVLIPTFSGIVTKAQISSAEQQFMNAYKEALAEVLANDGVIAAGETAFIGDKYAFIFKTADSNNASIGIVKKANTTYSLAETTDTAAINGYISATVTNGKVEISKSATNDMTIGTGNDGKITIAAPAQGGGN